MKCFFVETSFYLIVRVLVYESGPIDAEDCFLWSSGRGRSGWRPGSGGEEMEQENPADATWSPGTKKSYYCGPIILQISSRPEQLS